MDVVHIIPVELSGTPSLVEAKVSYEIQANWRTNKEAAAHLKAA